jgi:autotransporter-associated beta strand protein
LLGSALVAGMLPSHAGAQGPEWSGFAGNPQHTGISTVAAQAMDGTRWSTPVDLDPQYAGNGDLYSHYGSPLCTAQNTVIVPVKTGATNGFQVSAFNGTTGSLLWTQSTDYSAPSSTWTPSYSPTISPQNLLYYPGADGTVYYRGNLNSPGAVTPGQLAFYGLSNYQADPAAFSDVQICTPITSDSAGDIFFGFTVTGSNSLGLQSGIARISANGQGTWISANAAANGESYINNVQYNCAPALSADGSTLYIALNEGSDTPGCLVALNTATLQPKGVANLVSPDQQIAPAYVFDISTASPTVAPDGSVYLGVWTSGSQGYMLHFSSNLATSYAPGFFGWDATSSIVPASMVKSYTGSSSYLIMTKDNNYGTGQNQLVILDPNATQPYTDQSGGTATVMKVVESVLGPTPNPNTSVPGAVYEWCLNSAAVDPATDSIITDSEDGATYRWNLGTNTLTQGVQNAAPLGAAYTPTIIGADGTSYSINNGTLYATAAFQWNSQGSGVWSSTSSWFGPLPDGPGAVASFLTSTTGATTVTLDSSRTVGSIIFDSPYGYTIVASGSSVLTFSQTGGGPATIAVDEYYGGGAHAIAAPVLLDNDLVVSGSGTLTFTPASSITDSGSHSLTTCGPGLLVIAGSGSIGGATNVPTGTLEVDGQWSTSALNVTGSGGGLGCGQLAGSGTITLSGGDLTYNSTATSIFAGTLAGSTSASGLWVEGGVMVLSGSNCYSGGTTVSGGTLVLEGASALATGSSLMVGSGIGTFVSPAASNVPATSAPAPVPEPGGLIVMAIAALGYGIVNPLLGNLRSKPAVR